MKTYIPKAIILIVTSLIFLISCDEDNVEPANPNFVVSAGWTGTDASIRYSETGINWPLDYNTLISQTYLINGLAYGDNYFIGVGNGIYSYQSDDGINWIQTYLDSIVTYNDIALGEYHNQSPWAPYFVAVGNNGAVMNTSTHGKFWDGGTTDIIEDLNGVSYGLTTTGLSMFVAVGDAPFSTSLDAPAWGTILYSLTAGETWIKHTLGGSSRDLFCVAYGGGRFISAGGYGDMIYSTNGSVWQTVNSNTTKQINGISYGAANNSLVWVAVGNEGTILHSQDNGNNWVEQVFDENKTWKSVINVNNKFYAVGYGRDGGFTNGVEGKIIYSNNGIDWFTAASFAGYENYFRDIACKN